MGVLCGLFVGVSVHVRDLTQEPKDSEFLDLFLAVVQTCRSSLHDITWNVVSHFCWGIAYFAPNNKKLSVRFVCCRGPQKTLYCIIVILKCTIINTQLLSSTIISTYQ